MAASPNMRAFSPRSLGIIKMSTAKRMGESAMIDRYGKSIVFPQKEGARFQGPGSRKDFSLEPGPWNLEPNC